MLCYASLFYVIYVHAMLCCAMLHTAERHFFAVHSHLDFESMGTAQNDEFKGSFDSLLSASSRNSILTVSVLLTDT